MVNIATTVMLLDPSVGHILHALLTNPNAAIMNMMACKVYREVKFGKYGEPTAVLPLTLTWRVNPPTSSTSQLDGQKEEIGDSSTEVYKGVTQPKKVKYQIPGYSNADPQLITV